MKNGKGVWKKAAYKGRRGNKYEGYYERDKKHGYGEFTWESGNIYKGNYHYDQR
jgi:hypothetical protein